MEKTTPKGRTKDGPKRKEEKMTRKRKKQDQVKKASKGEDVYIQQLFGAEKSQVNRHKKENQRPERQAQGQSDGTVCWKEERWRAGSRASPC